MSANPFAAELTATAHPNRKGRWRFPLNDGSENVIASAFVVPLLRVDGHTWCLMQEEDEPEEGTRDIPIGKRPCTPKLAMLGGKVSAEDPHWVVTATREVAEETGTMHDGSTLLSDAALSDIKQGFRARCAEKKPDEAAAFWAYLLRENASAMLVFYPVPEAYRSEWSTLPERYATAFGGEVDAAKERHGTKLMWVRVRTSQLGPHEPILDLARIAHQCVANDQMRCAARRGHSEDGECRHAGQPLQLKRVLQLGLASLAERREALSSYLIANRLHHLLLACSHDEEWRASAERRPSVGQVTHTLMSAWSRSHKLRELEKAMEQKAWLVKEVDKMIGAKIDKKRPRDEEAARSDAVEAGSSEPRKHSSSQSHPTVRVTYGARHLLIKYDKSRNPVSKRTSQSTEGLSAEAARAELVGLRERILAEGGTQEVFARHAQERSDCSSFRRGGDLGEFASGKMQRAFEEATRACTIGGMSPVVQSDSGLHLIWRYK